MSELCAPEASMSIEKPERYVDYLMDKIEWEKKDKSIIDALNPPFFVWLVRLYYVCNYKMFITHTAFTPAINSVREMTFLFMRNIHVLMFA